jgi:hypothetical protein
LTLLAAPQPTNGFDLPSCCASPNLCQGAVFTVPQVDIGDGTGFHAMAHIAGTRYRYPAGATFPAVGYAQVVNACAGRPQRASLGIITSNVFPPFASVAALFEVDNVMTHVGSWYVPRGAPALAGQVVMLKTP